MLFVSLVLKTILKLQKILEFHLISFVNMTRVVRVNWNSGRKFSKNNLSFKLNFSKSLTQMVKINNCRLHEQLIQWNSVITNSVVNEHPVITNRFLGQIGHTQINPVITNRGYNEQKWPVPSCSL